MKHISCYVLLPVLEIIKQKGINALQLFRHAVIPQLGPFIVGISNLPLSYPG
jgi:hypothetical protein